MTFLQVLRLLFGMMLMFGAFNQMKGGEKGPYTRAFDYTLLGLGGVGSITMLALGLGKMTPGEGGGSKCGECGERTPLMRKPSNGRQMLWGGWTCAKCGTELDRRGRKIEEKG